MRSRSSRLFVILLHLVGNTSHRRNALHGDASTRSADDAAVADKHVSQSISGTTTTSISSSLNRQFSGIVGVNPWPVQMERIWLHQPTDENNKITSGRDESSASLPLAPNAREQQEEPIWLQDSHDGTCLGPTATFSECGDATLWLIQQRTSSSPASDHEAEVEVSEKKGRWRRWRRPPKAEIRAGNTKRDEDHASAPSTARLWSFQVADSAFDSIPSSGLVPFHPPLDQVKSILRLETSGKSRRRPWWRHLTRILRPQKRNLVSEVAVDVSSLTECLTHASLDNLVHVGACLGKGGTQWSVSEEGFLQVRPPHCQARHVGVSGGDGVDTKRSTEGCGPLCLYRSTSGNQATLEPCDRLETEGILNDRTSPSSSSSAPSSRKVAFSFMRYRAVTVTSTAAIRSTVSPTNVERLEHGKRQSPHNLAHSKLRGGAVRVSSSLPVAEKSPVVDSELAAEQATQQQPLPEHIPSSFDRAHSHASVMIRPITMHPELKLSSQLLFASSPQLQPRVSSHQLAAHGAGVSAGTKPEKSTRKKKRKGKRGSKKKKASKQEMASVMNNRHPFHLLQDTNPILFMTGTFNGSPARGTHINRHQSDNKNLQHRSPSAGSMAHPPSSTDEASYKQRRMHIHPYIATSQNEVWTDPQTGLEYFTDLCRYLGKERKKHGRHTLMGVGQYRKGFVIKVYGIAYYISKRDALADPVFERYAGLTVEQLRAKPEFYKYLRQQGKFDRTLLLKTNMQLSADTMRSSLHADWKMLTDEAKSTLINSSLEPRPADPQMMKLIQSPSNPGRCSCAQVAPSEYNADPTCCARGTELGFTWLKNGHLEVRLNGNLMDVFPRPDIAEGIFYEYLRTDDPISAEFRDHVVDGFPFLLAPLAQVQGVSIGQHSYGKGQDRSNPLFRAMMGVSEAAQATATDLAAMMQKGASDMADHAGNAARMMGDAAQNLVKEGERRRLLLIKSAMAMQESLTRFVSPEQQPTQVSILPVLLEEPEPLRKPSHGRVFGYPLSRWFSETYFAPDEIGPMKIHPTTRTIFLAMVHLYLLLLFIVSFPGSYTTRTKLVIRRDRGASKHELKIPANLIIKSMKNDPSNGESLVVDQIGAKALSAVNSRSIRISRHENGQKQPQQQHQKIISRGNNFMAQARKVLRPRIRKPIPVDPIVDDEVQALGSPQEQSSSGDNCLKKKSLSYFL